VLPQQVLLLKQLRGKIEALAAVDLYLYLKKLLVQHLTGMIHQPPQQFLNLVGVQIQMLSNEQFAELANQGGASRSFKTGESPTGPGIMVSVPGAEKITNAPYTAEQAKSFKEEHATRSIGDVYQGAWKTGGKIFSDISVKHKTLPEARKAGVENKQIAGYDLGGTDVRRSQGGNVYFGRKVPGVESNPEFVASAHRTAEYERMEPKPKAQEFAEQAQISRGATYKGKKISVNEVYATIAKNRRNRGV
jgi:hypothetical protein